MNGSSAINEQLIGKFHVTNVDTLPVNNHEDLMPQTSSIGDESGCTSRFQMIRVDRNFGRGRWKVNDYEPPENTSVVTIPSMNTIENESINHSNVPSTTIPLIPTVITGDSNATSSAAFAATSVAPAAATAFQQQQRMAHNNTPIVMPTANVPPPTNLLHAYPPGALPNQSYILPTHPHQFGYYPFYPPYSPYATPWGAAALAAANPYLQPPTLGPPQQQTTSQLSATANLNDPTRMTDIDMNGENTFPNLTSDQLQNVQLAAAMSYLYAAQHSHSPFVQQTSSTGSSYATIPSYHPVQHPPTILPPQTLLIPNNPIDTQQSQQIPLLTSPKHDGTKNLQQSSLITTPKAKPLVPTGFNDISNDPVKITQVNDLISSSPALISPINISTTNPPPTSLSDIWTYTTSGSPLNLVQTAQTAAVTAMGLLNNDTSQNTEMANEILKELTTPTKQNNFSLSERRACLRLRRQLSTTDIDNKISAAMDLVKMHLLSAVREEVTELRQQIRTLNEKLNNIEHENTFFRQHISSEIYAQYIPPSVVLSSSNDSTNSTTNPICSIPPPPSSSQPIPITSLSTIPSSLAQQTILSTTNFPLT